MINLILGAIIILINIIGSIGTFLFFKNKKNKKMTRTLINIGFYGNIFLFSFAGIYYKVIL